MYKPKNDLEREYELLPAMEMFATLQRNGVCLCPAEISPHVVAIGRYYNAPLVRMQRPDNTNIRPDDDLIFADKTGIVNPNGITTQQNG